MAQIFIDNHNRIMSYGNPAGYIKDDKAIADPMFKTDELTAFLTRHNFQTSWQDGVFDRLLQGQQMGASPDAPVLKNLRIWQLNNATPIEMRFISYDSLTHSFGEPDPGTYQSGRAHV